MTSQQQSILTDFLKSVSGIPWFSNCGNADVTAIVPSDLIEAWDRWNDDLLPIWLPQTNSLEDIAIIQIGEADLSEIFRVVSDALDIPKSVGMEEYYDRHPAKTEASIANTDRGLWPEWLETVKRDLCWAAVEAVLNRSGFFSELLKYYRAGRWPCGWEHTDRSGRVVIL